MELVMKKQLILFGLVFFMQPLFGAKKIIIENKTGKDKTCHFYWKNNKTTKKIPKNHCLQFDVKGGNAPIGSVNCGPTDTWNSNPNQTFTKTQWTKEKEKYYFILEPIKKDQPEGIKLREVNEEKNLQCNSRNTINIS